MPTKNAQTRTTRWTRERPGEEGIIGRMQPARAQFVWSLSWCHPPEATTGEYSGGLKTVSSSGGRPTGRLLRRRLYESHRGNYNHEETFQPHANISQVGSFSNRDSVTISTTVLTSLCRARSTACCSGTLVSNSFLCSRFTTLSSNADTASLRRCRNHGPCPSVPPSTFTYATTFAPLAR